MEPAKGLPNGNASFKRSTVKKHGLPKRDVLSRGKRRTTVGSNNKVSDQLKGGDTHNSNRFDHK